MNLSDAFIGQIVRETHKTLSPKRVGHVTGLSLNAQGETLLTVYFPGYAPPFDDPWEVHPLTQDTHPANLEAVTVLRAEPPRTSGKHVS